MSVTPWWIVIAVLGWSTAIMFFGWYRIEKWRADEFTKLHASALKHWDETREALRAAIFPAAIKSPEKEFKS